MEPYLKAPNIMSLNMAFPFSPSGVITTWTADVWTERGPSCCPRGRLVTASCSARQTTRTRSVALSTATSSASLGNQQSMIPDSFHRCITLIRQQNVKPNKVFCFSFKNLDWKPRLDGNNSAIYTAIKGSGDDDDDDGDCCDIDIVMVMMIMINVEKNFHCSVLLFPVRLVGKYLY